MDGWLEFAGGPLFRFALAFMILGLLRHLIQTVWEAFRARQRAGDKTINWKKLWGRTVSWLIPITRLKENRTVGITTLAFHIAVLLTPIFLSGHGILLAKSTGINWPTMPNSTADILTLVAMITALLLLGLRFFSPDRRVLSRFGDFFLPGLVFITFFTGFLAMHPSVNPWGHTGILLFHLLSAETLMIILPLSKLSHIVILPLSQLISELGWRFPATSGSEVGTTLGKEDEPI